MNEKLRKVLAERKEEIDLKCLSCGKKFTVSRAYFNAGHGFFHNRKCAAEFQKRARATRTINRMEFPKSEEGSIKRLIERAAKLRDSIENTVPKEAPKTKEVKT